MSCPINTSIITNFPGYNTTIAYLNNAADSVGLARDAAFDFANTNLPESANSALSTVSDAINAFYCTGPAFAGTVLCGIAGGYLFSGKKPISINNAKALVAVAAGILLTSNKTDLAILAGTTIATAGVHFAAKKIGLMN